MCNDPHTDPADTGHLIGCLVLDLVRVAEAAQTDNRRLLNFVRRVAAGEQSLQFEALRLLHEFEESGPTERPACVGSGVDGGF